MSRHSTRARTRASDRSAKTVRRGSKKASKSARASASRASAKSAKTSRRTERKQPRPMRSGAQASAKALHSKHVSMSSAATVPAVATAPVAVTTNQAVRAVWPSSSVASAHKFHVGETVYFTSPSFGRAATSGTYTIVKLLPSESDDYQYRIKSTSEAFERVAKESQLDKA